jgi:hypothetical protein
MPLATKLRAAGIKERPEPLKPLWAGPENFGALGGVTQSLLNDFLLCRERFRVKYLEGLQLVDQFSHRLEYGNMWHVCEEAFAMDQDVGKELQLYCQQLGRRYGTAGEQITQWYNICKVQFPLYVKWWAQHPDMKNRLPLAQEQVFNVPYKLPSGRTVYLRGRWDSVDAVKDGKLTEVWLQENKTKGDIDERHLIHRLRFDIQSMFYVVALQEFQRSTKLGGLLLKRNPIVGVRYNVIRRPLAGGKGTIKRKKDETAADFYTRLGAIIEQAVGTEYGLPPGEHFFFMRWNVRISQNDIDRFKHRFLDPFLTTLCDWYDVVTKGHYLDPFFSPLHFQTPFGLYNPIAEGRGTDVDEYLENGSKIGLRRADKLFRELE